MGDRFKPNSHAWWTRVEPNGNPRAKWPVITTIVRVMTIAEGYAMVRNAGCMPFVVSLAELEFFCGKTEGKKP